MAVLRIAAEVRRRPVAEAARVLPEARHREPAWPVALAVSG